jgi:hypothetical protein
MYFLGSGASAPSFVAVKMRHLLPVEGRTFLFGSVVGHFYLAPTLKFIYDRNDSLRSKSTCSRSYFLSPLGGPILAHRDRRERWDNQ